MESEINDTEIVSLLASPLNTQEREASADEPRICNSESAVEPRICHPDRENSGRRSSSVRSGIGKPMPVLSHGNEEIHSHVFKGESQALKKENLRNIKKSENSWSYKQIEQFKENRKLFPSFHARILLEEQQNHILAQKRYERVWQERRADKAESSKQHSGKQFLTHPKGNGRIEESAAEFALKSLRKSQNAVTYSPHSGIARRSKCHH